MPSLQIVADLPGHTEPAWCVSWNPTRSLLASCSTDKTVRLYSYTASPTSGADFPAADTPKANFSLSTVVSTAHKRTIRSIAWAPNGRTFATGSFDSTVGIWEEVDPDSEEEAEGEEGIDRAGHTHGPRCSHGHSHSHTDEHNEEGEDDEDGIVGDGKDKSWECVTTLEGHESECKSVGWSGEGGLLASCSRDKSVWVWEGEWVPAITNSSRSAGTTGPPTAGPRVSCTANERLLLSCKDRFADDLVQPDSDFECIAVMMEHTQDVKSLAWNPKEEILASASYDSHIHLLWDDPSGDWCPFQKLHPKLPASPLTIPSTATSVVAALRPTPSEAKALEELSIPPLVEDETVWSLAWSPDGKYLASGGDLGGIRIWRRSGHNPDSPLREVLHTAAHGRSIFALSWAEGGLGESEGGLGLLASAGGDGKIIIWQISQSSESADVKVDIKPIAAVRDAHGVSDINSVAWCVRKDGKGAGMLASCGDDGSVKVWRAVQD